MMLYTPGTGGVPILGSINGKGLSDVLVAVVRYSGGIKLGAGGLIRAYGGSASLALNTAPTITHIPKATIRISTRAANSGAIYAAAAKYNAVTSGETYNDRGELEVTITCDEENSDQLKDAINDATSGGTQYT
jgi:putative IMPACT (imprinted ancient) family translation regulator